jgi:2-polyprenyl-3-methyl-5-hydroxy-6-metoxy-1,4-benzoquinol methylase
MSGASLGGGSSRRGIVERKVTREELERRHADIVARHGEWTYDIPLTHGFWTRGNEGDPHTRLRRVLQAIDDLVPKPLDACRVLDLGCLEGQYAIECALQGASVLGIEAREASLAKANFAKDALGLSLVEFVRDDVRNLSVEKYGEFDVIICSGILYHLDTPDVFHLIARVHEMARRLVVIDTHVSLRPNATVEFQGGAYHGERLPERHATPDGAASGSSGPPSTKELWAGVGNEASFTFSRPSLLNALAAAGFTSVYECLNPPHLGRRGVEHVNRCTFAAVTGREVELLTSPGTKGFREGWPEGALSYPPPGPLRHLRRLRALLRRIRVTPTGSR